MKRILVTITAVALAFTGGVPVAADRSASPSAVATRDATISKPQ
jgi:hypothetical protein